MENGELELSRYCSQWERKNHGLNFILNGVFFCFSFSSLNDKSLDFLLLQFLL